MSDKLPGLKAACLTLFAKKAQSSIPPNRTPPTILYCFGPEFYWTPKYINHDLFVYHAYDDFSRFNNDGSTYSTFMEKQSLRDADLVVASSDAIADRIRSLGRSDVIIVPNGGNFEEYSSAPKEQPIEMQNKPRPRVGYFGRVNCKVDLKLIDDVSDIRPHYHWFFVGSVMEDELHKCGQGEALMRLYNKRNIHFLGEKDVNYLPDFAHSMDILSMTYKTSDGGWWRSIYPLKLHEYLSTGKPVVSTSVPSVRSFSHVVDIRDGADEFALGLDAALSNEGAGTLETRREVAAENSWDKRVDEIEMQIIQALS